MQYDIRQEAGEEFAGLGRLIEEMTPQVAPHVEEVTALPLPKTLTIRIVTVPEWMRLWALHDKRLLAAEVEALSLTGAEAEQGRASLSAAREAHRRKAIGAQTVRYEEDASVVVLADNLREAGQFQGGAWSTPYVRTMLAHELTHVGQMTAGGEGYRLLTSTPFPQHREHAHRNWAFAAEGYAVWADDAITARMGADQQTTGHPAHGGVPSARWSGSDMPTRVLDHVQAAQTPGLVGSAQTRQTLRWYTESGRAVRDVVTACGVRGVNRIWTQHHLLPTDAEERDHLAWQRRLVGLPPGARGPGDFAAGLLPGRYPQHRHHHARPHIDTPRASWSRPWPAPCLSRPGAPRMNATAAPLASTANATVTTGDTPVAYRGQRRRPRSPA